MIRRPIEGPSKVARTARGRARTRAVPQAGTELSRNDKLVALIDHLLAAKQSADDLGAHLLSYLLAMAIQESRMALRSTQTGERQ